MGIDNVKREKLKNKIIKTQKEKIVGGARYMKNINKVSSPFISSSESEEEEEERNVMEKTKKTNISYSSGESDNSTDTSDIKSVVPLKKRSTKVKKNPAKL